MPVKSSFARYWRGSVVPMTRLGARGLWLSFGTLSSRSTQALGLVYASRGYLTFFLKDAAAAFFAFLKRIPLSGIPRLDAAAFGRPEFVEAAAKATMMQEEVHQQMAGAWPVVSGQQAEADVKRRLSISELREATANAATAKDALRAPGKRRRFR
jgi:hypothetical protein